MGMVPCGSSVRIAPRRKKRRRPKARTMAKPNAFGDFKAEGHKWITLATGDYYPDILKDA
jgi:hypothetical protein